MAGRRNVSTDELEVDLKADGLRLSSKGDAAARLGEAIADALSPFTNALGWVGDHLTIKRRQAVLRAAKKAEERLAQEGITGADIPPRILLPWLEGASMETEEDPTLTDMWAGLFARAAKSSDAVVISYIETLKRLGAEEAGLLDFFATDRSPHFTQAFYSNSFEAWSQRNPLFWSKVKIYVEGHDIRGFKEWIEQAAIQSMRKVMFVRDRDGRIYPSQYFIDHEHAISNMENLGIINVKEKGFEAGKHRIDVIWFEISKYGFDLVWAANGRLTGIKAGQKKSKDTEEKNA